MHRLTGIGVSPGVAVGRAVVLIQRTRALRYHVAAERLERELARLDESRTRTHEQVTAIRARVARSRGSDIAALFDAQLLMLDDPLLVPRAADLVRAQRVNADWALQQVFAEFTAIFDEVADPYLRERTGDVADVVGRLRMNLRRGAALPRDLLRQVEGASVLVADELTPSLAAQIDWTKLGGFATDAGSRTYHTAILARSFEVPAVVGLREASRLVRPGEMVVIDGSENEFILDPDPELLDRLARGSTGRRSAPHADARRRQPVTTADGVPIRVEANIELSTDLAAARYVGAEGIGLYRSEFLLTPGATPIGEDEQYEIYRGLLEGMAPEPVTVRTFDVDESQVAARALGPPAGDGWATGDQRTSRQGLRGLRLSLTRPELFQTQLRALLRAAQHGRLRILFPFVSGVEQVVAARRMIADASDALARRGISVPAVPLGVMIEIPAAAYTADLLAREVDFFTIGTNDLIQYCLAVDRADPSVSDLYAPLHPAMLRLIVMVRRAAARRRIPVSVCGEMASDPALLTLLVGLGLREFSMTPGAIGTARQVLAGVRADELRLLATHVLRLATAGEIENELRTAMDRLQEQRG